LKYLLDSKEPTFIAGSASNMAKFYPLFDRIFALSVDDATLEQQLLQRRTEGGHVFGQTDADIQRNISVNQDRLQAFEAAGAVIIPNNQPAPVIAQHIVSLSLDH
jgi:hypothetical protein